MLLVPKRRWNDGVILARRAVAARRGMSSLFGAEFKTEAEHSSFLETQAELPKGRCCLR